MSDIKGAFTGSYSDIHHGFVYAYHCQNCGQTFMETTPEISAPALCHQCATGSRDRSSRRRHEARQAKKRK
jgi:hypothetical protein